MVSALDSGSSGPGSSLLPGSLCCVLRQDTLLSQCFSSPRCTDGYQQICWGWPYDGLASHSGGSSNTPSCFILSKPELSAGPMGHLGLYNSFTFYLHKHL